MTSSPAAGRKEAGVPEDARQERQDPWPEGPAPWWAGIFGLDPRYQPPPGAGGIELAASSAAIACSLRFLSPRSTGRRWERRDEDLGTAEQWAAWLRGTADAGDAYLRRLALLLTGSKGVPPENILATARAVHEACTPTASRKETRR